MLFQVSDAHESSLYLSQLSLRCNFQYIPSGIIAKKFSQVNLCLTLKPNKESLTETDLRLSKNLAQVYICLLVLCLQAGAAYTTEEVKQKILSRGSIDKGTEGLGSGPASGTSTPRGRLRYCQ